MTKHSTIDRADLADERSERGLRSDISKANASAKFAAFAHEYRVDCGHYNATNAEIQEAYERSK